jgi:hypothetical protein
VCGVTARRLGGRAGAGAATWDREATDLGGHAHAVFTIVRQAAERVVQRQEGEEARRAQTDTARDGEGRSTREGRERRTSLPAAAMRAVAAAVAWVTQADGAAGRDAAAEREVWAREEASRGGAPDALTDAGVPHARRWKPPNVEFEVRYWCNSTADGRCAHRRRPCEVEVEESESVAVCSREA